MLPFKSLIELDRQCRKPIYVQLSNEIINLIQKGHLRPESKLPGTRSMAKLLALHRITVVRAYDELIAQGWIQAIPKRGTFVSERLPISKRKPLDKTKTEDRKHSGRKPFYGIEKITGPYVDNKLLAFDDGSPDTRLAPVRQLASSYAGNLRRISDKRDLSYVDPRGYLGLRAALAHEFNESRGLKISPDEIMITKGSQMGMFMLSQTCIRPGDRVVVGAPNYFVADMCFEHHGAELIRIPVDKHGLVIEDLSMLCKRRPIRAVFITSHHHHPTTVTLCPERRISLLSLAEQYGFIIIEDDYDYDFHYENSPVLPLASADDQGQVAYIGSFSKTVAPAFRIGYVIARRDLIDEMIKIRRIVDRQGDPVLERAFADMLQEGVIRRHHKKALKTYHQRRDKLAQLMEDLWSDITQFDVPNGGLAIWTHFDPRFPLRTLAKKAAEKNLHISHGADYHYLGEKQNATRLGFGSLNETEMDQAAGILDRIMRSL